MAKVANLSADLTANTISFEAGLKRASGLLDSFGARVNRTLALADKSFKSVGEGITKFGGEIFSLKGAAAAILGTVGGAGLIELARNALEAVGGIGELADQLGVTTDTLQAFQYAATQVGLSQEDLQTGLAKFTKTVGEAADGNKTAIDTFDRLGIKILDAGGNLRSTDSIIHDAADAIAKIPDPAKRAAAATDLMGKSGQKLLTLFQGGSAGLDAFIQKAKDLGLVFDPQTIANADTASDKLATMALVIKTKLEAALVTAAPLFDAFANKVIDLITALNNWYSSTQQAPTAAGNLAKLTEELQKEQAVLDKLEAQATDGNIWNTIIQGLGGAREQDKAIIDAQNRVHQLQQVVAEASKLTGPDFKGRGNGFNPPAAPKGVRNPDALINGKTQGQIDAENTAKAIADLQFQLDQIGRSDLEQRIATALKGLKGTPADVQRVRDIVTATYQVEQDQKDMNAELEEENRLREKGKQLAESLLTPAEKYKETLREITAEEQAGGLSAEQAALAREKAHEDYRQALGITDIIDANKTSLERYNEQISHLNDLMATGELSAEDYNRAVKAAKDAYDQASNAGSDFKQSVQDASSVISTDFEDAVLGGKKLTDVLADLDKNIERIIIRLAVTKPFENWFGGLVEQVSSGNGWLSSLFGNGSSSSSGVGVRNQSTGNFDISSGGGIGSWLTDIGSSIGSWFSGLGFAGGGRPPLGQYSWVGENGPELWKPDTAGTIIPASELKSAPAAGGDLNVSFVFSTPQAVDAFNRSPSQQAYKAARTLQAALARGG